MRPTILILRPSDRSGVYDCPDHEAVSQVRLGFSPFRHRSGNDGCGGTGKYHLEHEVNVGLASIIG